MATYALVLTTGLAKLSASATGSSVGGVASKIGWSITTLTKSTVPLSAAVPIYVSVMVAFFCRLHTIVLLAYRS
jgi:hypothetical protein